MKTSDHAGRRLRTGTTPGWYTDFLCHGEEDDEVVRRGHPTGSISSSACQEPPGSLRDALDPAVLIIAMGSPRHFVPRDDTWEVDAVRTLNAMNPY